MLIDEIKKAFTAYEITKITESTFEQVMEIYRTNQDFFMLTEGKKPTLENSIRDVDAVPPGFRLENKIYIGVWQNGEMIGVLDLLMGYPEQNCVWIGLLLIHGKLHGKGIGGSIVTAIFEAARIAGYQTIQLGVIENNIQGIRFWDRQGFKKIRESAQESARPIVVMEKRI